MKVTPAAAPPEQEPEPLELELWCLIVGMVGTAFPVVLKGSDRVWELQKTIKNEAVEIYGDFNALQLRVYLARKDDGKWLAADEVERIENGDRGPAEALMARGHLTSMSHLAEIFTDRDASAVHVLVSAPPNTPEIQVEADAAGKRKRSDELVGDAKAIGVSAQELSVLFGVLGQKMQTEHKLVVTAALSEFWKGYGGFPASYFVRKEELVLWGLVMRFLLKADRRIAIVGSSGVGKSCFLTLVGFYLAMIKKRRILIVRRLKDFYEASAVVYLDGEKNICTRKANLTAAQISALPGRKEYQGALVLVDGYSRAEVDHQFGLLPFQLLSTSMEDRTSFDDSTCEVMLPGWQHADLLQYAKLTLYDWKKSTGLDQDQHKETLALVNEQYFYSGGSLRDFCTNRGDVKNGMAGICDIVRQMQTVDLEEADPHGSESFDRIRREYVGDPSDEDHYWQVPYWRVQIDSGYALQRIGRFMDWEQHFGQYEFAHRVRAGYWGEAYAQCFHGSVRRSRQTFPMQLINVVVNSDPSYSNQRYDRIELHAEALECEGVTELECYARLSKLSAGTYWYPDCGSFPLVDAVVVCEAVLRGSSEKETIVAFISTTVSDKKAFKPEIWADLKKALDENESIPGWIPRVFVAVGPEVTTCKRMTVIDAPTPDDFMVCCYDPLKFLRRSPHARIA
jgi:hypothetical protein